MRPGWNPTRRNKHIGTAAQGHGNNNQLVIPQSWHDCKLYWEKLDGWKLVTRRIADRDILFFVEPVSPGYFHPCSIDDITHVLSHCPQQDLAQIDYVVLRQPTRKERILAPVWGRALWWFELGEHAGPAIMLEAQSLAPIRWSRSLTPELRKELARLEQDGHQIDKDRRSYIIRPSAESVRNTTLYRTLLHELGHHVDFARTDPDDWAGKTKTAKEEFAHRYASEQFQRLKAMGGVPFVRRLDLGQFSDAGVNPDWFTPPPLSAEC